jgi:hypothetical protein
LAIFTFCKIGIPRGRNHGRGGKFQSQTAPPPPTPISRAGVKVAVGVKPLGEKVLVLQRSCLSELRTNHKLGVKMVFMVVEVLSVLTFSLE